MAGMKKPKFFCSNCGEKLHSVESDNDSTFFVYVCEDCEKFDEKFFFDKGYRAACDEIVGEICKKRGGHGEQ